MNENAITVPSLTNGVLGRNRAETVRRADILVNTCQASKWKSGGIAQLVASMPSNASA
jgi:hypothetical protein